MIHTFEVQYTINREKMYHIVWGHGLLDFAATIHYPESTLMKMRRRSDRTHLCTVLSEHEPRCNLIHYPGIKNVQYIVSADMGQNLRYMVRIIVEPASLVAGHLTERLFVCTEDTISALSQAFYHFVSCFFCIVGNLNDRHFLCPPYLYQWKAHRVDFTIDFHVDYPLITKDIMVRSHKSRRGRPYKYSQARGGNFEQRRNSRSGKTLLYDKDQQVRVCHSNDEQWSFLDFHNVIRFEYQCGITTLAAKRRKYHLESALAATYENPKVLHDSIYLYLFEDLSDIILRDEYQSIFGFGDYVNKYWMSRIINDSHYTPRTKNRLMLFTKGIGIIRDVYKARMKFRTGYHIKGESNLFQCSDAQFLNLQKKLEILGMSSIRLPEKWSLDPKYGIPDPLHFRYVPNPAPDHWLTSDQLSARRSLRSKLDLSN